MSPEKIKEEIVRLYDLPESFMETPPPPTPLPQQPGAGMGGAPEEAAMNTLPGDVGAQGEVPTQQLAQMLGGGI